jgi:hypothetical protein
MVVYGHLISSNIQTSYKSHNFANQVTSLTLICISIKVAVLNRYVWRSSMPQLKSTHTHGYSDILFTQMDTVLPEICVIEGYEY